MTAAKADMRRIRIPLLTKGLISVSLVAILVLLVDLSSAWESLRHVDPGQLGLAVAGGLFGLAVQWVKWQNLLSHVRPGTTRKEGFQSLLAGFAVGLFSPARIGELSRGIFLPSQRLVASAAAAADRLCSFVVTLLAGTVCLLFLWPAAGLVAAVVALLAALLGLRWLRGEVDDARGKGVVEHTSRWPMLSELVAALRRLPGGIWLGTLAWSGLFNLIFFTQFLILLRGLGGELALSVILAIPVIFSIKALLPVGVMDLGVREVSAVVVFRSLGLDPSPAFDAALLLYVINVLTPGLLGLFFVGRSVGGATENLWRVERVSPSFAKLLARWGRLRNGAAGVETGV